MLPRTILTTSVLASIARADSISFYLGTSCNGAPLGKTDPIPVNECIPFGQAQSYIAQIDDGNVYNLYSGADPCDQYEGQLSFSGCSKIDSESGSAPTHILNIGPKPKKRALSKTKAANFMRGVSFIGAKRDEIIFDRNGNPILRRVDGDTYQCENTPYYFVVQSSSAAKLETTIDDDIASEETFESAFTAAYDQGGQTQVRSETTIEEGERVVITMTFNEGTVNFVGAHEADDLVTSLTNFREAQGFPAEFLVSIYTGIPGNNGGVGPFADFRWLLN